MTFEFTTIEYIAIAFIAVVLLYGLVGPWLALFDLKHLSGIERELRKIREELEKRRGVR